MAIPIITDWKNYFTDEDEGLGSSYERVILNNLLSRICREHSVHSVLEAPVFGFTGLSGINSMNLAKEGKKVTLVDNNSERLVMIEKVWQGCKLPVDLKYSDDFSSLPFTTEKFDLCWNFSALWFVKDLELFLKELDKLTQKVILLTVPNRTGIGYIFQSLTGNKGHRGFINKEWIKHFRFSKIMHSLGWKEAESGLIDCPPWPDIGMKKELLAKKLCLSFLIDRDSDEEQQTSILSYYRGQDDSFPQRLMKYNFFERKCPRLFKWIWAHHHYYLYVRS